VSGTTHESVVEPMICKHCGELMEVEQVDGEDNWCCEKWLCHPCKSAIIKCAVHSPESIQQSIDEALNPSMMHR